MMYRWLGRRGCCTRRRDGTSGSCSWSVLAPRRGRRAPASRGGRSRGDGRAAAPAGGRGSPGRCRAGSPRCPAAGRACPGSGASPGRARTSGTVGRRLRWPPRRSGEPSGCRQHQFMAGWAARRARRAGTATSRPPRPSARSTRSADECRRARWASGVGPRSCGRLLRVGLFARRPPRSDTAPADLWPPPCPGAPGHGPPATMCAMGTSSNVSAVTFSATSARQVRCASAVCLPVERPEGAGSAHGGSGRPPRRSPWSRRALAALGLRFSGAGRR